MNDKRIKALWLASWWPRPDHPIYGIFTKRDAEAVAAYCELIVVHARHHSGNHYEFEVRTNKAGYEEMTVLCPKSWIPQLGLLIGYLKAAKKIIRSNWQPDVVHVHILSIAGIAALFLKNKLKTPLFLSEHWSGYSLDIPPIGFARQRLGKFLIPKLSAVFTVTQAMAKAMKRLGFIGNYIVNPNVVNTDFFDLPVSVKPNNLFRFIHVSSLDEEHKNIAGLIRAFKKVVELKPQTRLVLLGGDEGTKNARLQVESLGIADVVSIMGVQNHEIICKELRESHAFILFSNREGLPCVMLEAMAVGLPVITTNLPGMEGWINEENGILVARKDELALTDAMLSLMDSINGFDPKRIREKIVRECSYTAVGSRIVAAYDAALAAAKMRS